MPIGLRADPARCAYWEFTDRFRQRGDAPHPRLPEHRRPPGFDGRGNFNLGLTEQYIFPETNGQIGQGAPGMNVTMVTTAGRDDTAREIADPLGHAV